MWTSKLHPKTIKWITMAKTENIKMALITDNGCDVATSHIEGKRNSLLVYPFMNQEECSYGERLSSISWWKSLTVLLIGIQKYIKYMYIYIRWERCIYLSSWRTQSAWRLKFWARWLKLQWLSRVSAQFPDPDAGDSCCRSGKTW